MLFDKKSFLKSEIIKLTNEGYISKEQESNILNSYLREESSFPILMLLGFIFIGLAILTIIAYNWQEIPNIIKTFLLLSALFSTHLGIFFARNSILRQGFGILSSFVLLANLALLSQIYHLGEDTALALLNVGCATLILALTIKSFAVFIVGYFFAISWFLLNLYNGDSATLFLFVLALGILVQSGIPFSLSLNTTRFLAFVNFMLLGLYLSDFQNQNLAFVWLSLLALGVHYRTYNEPALLILALMLPILSYYATSEVILSSSFLYILFLFLMFLNLYLKHYLLGILIVIFLAISLFADYQIDALFSKVSYSLLAFIFGVYLFKEGYKILGFLTLFLLALVRYIDLLGDYIGASLIFLCFGIALLLANRKLRA